MHAGDTPRFKLREATAGAHERVDALFSHTDLADRGHYGRFLAAQATAHLPVEQALEAGGVAKVIADWPDRRRAAQLRADLAALGVAEPGYERSPVLRGEAALLGAAYVLEGSRLGGTMLRRSVPDDFPATFLGGGRPGAWREFVEILDQRLANEEDLRTAIQTACAVFALFEASAQRLMQG